MCITVDDLPTVTYGTHDLKLQSEIIDKLVQTFNKFSIPAIGYVCESKLYAKGKIDSSKVRLLEKWLANGYDLGNHTFSHYDYNKVSDSLFFADIIKGEYISKPLTKRFKKEFKFFRHPYLHTGMDSTSATKLHQYLSDHSYVEAPVTIDNDDYVFAKAYHFAFIANDTNRMARIGDIYTKYMTDKLLYYESKSTEVFNHPISQTLLIHASLLNADYLDQIISIYSQLGYTFITQQEVINSPEYSTPITNYSKKGLSWIFRWGLSTNHPPLLMEDDILVPEEIIQLSTLPTIHDRLR